MADVDPPLTERGHERDVAGDERRPVLESHHLKLFTRPCAFGGLRDDWKIAHVVGVDGAPESIEIALGFLGCL
ncbi:MAG: hypothetical protein E6G39_10750 [Actinobacteria bacterium]|nr:MAG: hypothetical protein E6G39_10750 [Actinomycetota bacterium]